MLTVVASSCGKPSALMSLGRYSMRPLQSANPQIALRQRRVHGPHSAIRSFFQNDGFVGRVRIPILASNLHP